MKKAAMGRWLALLVGSAATLGCSGGDSINIGNSQKGSQLSDYVGSWDGYAEAYNFQPDGSDRVRLTIAADGTGTVEVGNEALVAPPTDPSVGYPPGSEPALGYDVNTTPISEAFLYPIYNPQVQTSRIQFGLKPNDFYAAWCGIQTSYYILTGWMGSGISDPPGGPDGGLVPTYGYSCVPGSGGGSSGTGADQQCYAQSDSVDGGYTNTPVDCGKFNLCLEGVCTCTANGCTASPTVDLSALPSGYPAEMDAALDSAGKTLTGTLAMQPRDGQSSSMLRLTVVLTKQ